MKQTLNLQKKRKNNWNLEIQRKKERKREKIVEILIFKERRKERKGDNFSTHHSPPKAKESQKHGRA